MQTSGTAFTEYMLLSSDVLCDVRHRHGLLRLFRPDEARLHPARREGQAVPTLVPQEGEEGPVGHSQVQTFK